MTLSPQSTYQTRTYQTSLLQEVFSQWQSSHRRVMLQLPTGGGKTVLFAAIAREFVSSGEGVLVLAHREELIIQAQEKVEQITGAPVGIIKAGHKPNPLFPIQVASVQTLTRRDNLPPAALVICDEAHHSCSQSYKRIFESYPHAYILGVTATPARIDGQGFKFLYDALVLGPSVAELIELQYLSKFKLFAATKLPDQPWFPVRTERLLLREFVSADLEDVHAYASDPEVSRYMDWGPNDWATSVDVIDRWLKVQQNWPRADVNLAVVLPDSGRVIGSIRLGVKDEANRTGDFGYSLHRDAWGLGYATEATRAMIDIGFGVLGLHRIWATADVRNARSYRVMEKLGMRREAHYRRDACIRGEWRDTCRYAILSDEWASRRAI